MWRHSLDWRHCDRKVWPEFPLAARCIRHSVRIREFQIPKKKKKNGRLLTDWDESFWQTQVKTFPSSFKTAQNEPPAAMSVTFPTILRFSFVGVLICWTPSCCVSWPYSEFPHPKTSPLSFRARTQSPTLEIFTIFSFLMSPSTTFGLWWLW